MVTVSKQAKIAIAIILIILVCTVGFLAWSFREAEAIISCDNCAPGATNFLCMDGAESSVDWFCSRDCSNNVPSECDGKKQLECIGSTGQWCDAQCRKTTPPAENTAAKCSDGKDNDCDGKTDCADPDCCNADKTCKKDNKCYTACGASARCQDFSPNTNLVNCNVGNTGISDKCDSNCQQVDRTDVSCTKTAYCTADRECVGKAPGSCSTVSGWACSTSTCKKVAAASEVCDGRDNDCDGSTDEGAVCNDINNCGSYGNQCTKGSNVNRVKCQNGQCKIDRCNSGYGDCDNNYANGCEKNINTDKNNCGSCRNVCSYAHAAASCQNGQCQMGACDDGWGNCDNNAANGCEINLNFNVNHCGSCGNACSLPHTATHSCSYGNCLIATCDSGWYNANWNHADGCECQKTNNGIEICDGLDNDCNNQIDDSLTDAPQYCANQTGVCEGATKSCGGEAGWLDCNYNTYFSHNSSYETNEATCDDGLDNDCDGLVDKEDLLDCVCKTGDTESCYSGPEGTANVGVCVNGTRNCTNGVWGECTGQILPNEEVCNQTDDDCDGIVDNVGGGESIEETKCGCYNGASPAAEENATNSIDDDCDSKLHANESDADRDGFAIYQGDCNDADSNVNPLEGENCINGIDDNCNGEVDEGCGQGADQSSGGKHTSSKKFTIGNDKCELGESSENACVDCGCPTGKTCVDNVCVLDDPAAATAAKKVAPKPAMPGVTKQISPKLPFFPLAFLWIAVLVAVLAGGLGGYFLYYKPKKELEDLGEVQEAKPGAPESTIKAFASSGLAEGYSPEQVSSSLVDKGLPPDDVHATLTDLSKDLGTMGKLAEKHGVHYAHEDVEKVNSYLKVCLKKGFTPSQVKIALRSAGWPESAIEDAFAAQPKLTKDLDKLAKKYKVQRPLRNKEKIPDFVKESLNKGHTVSQVKGKLIDIGWPEPTIKKQVPI